MIASTSYPSDLQYCSRSNVRLRVFHVAMLNRDQPSPGKPKVESNARSPLFFDFLPFLSRRNPTPLPPKAGLLSRTQSYLLNPNFLLRSYRQHFTIACIERNARHRQRLRIIRINPPSQLLRAYLIPTNMRIKILRAWILLQRTQYRIKKHRVLSVTNKQVNTVGKPFSAS